MADAPKDIAAALTAESSSRIEEWSKQWNEFRKKGPYKTWATDRAGSKDKATQSRKDLFQALAKYVHAQEVGLRQCRVQVLSE